MAAQVNEATGRRVVVIGSGPAGYTAAFRAADLGLDVTLIERYETLGGVCLKVGCIPSKALLHAARVIAEVEEAEGFGISYGKPEIDIGRLDEWKGEVVGKLTGGLAGLAKRRMIDVITGEARFASPNEVEVGGQKIAKGDWLMINYVAANHDPAVFDQPRRFDAARSPNRHLAFGAGAHQCLGLHLAKLEMRILFETLLDRIDSVELAGEPARSKSTFVGGLKTLPLRIVAR